MSAERKVLVVDDDETVCLVAVGCLEGWPGTEVDCAHDGPSGLKRLQDTRYNLTLIDGTLSGFTGLDLAEAAVNDDVPVLMICGHPEMTARLVAADFPHLEKPFRLAQLLSESQNVVAHSRENIARVRASLSRLKENAGALQAVTKESRRLLGESMEQSARAEGRALK